MKMLPLGIILTILLSSTLNAAIPCRDHRDPEHHSMYRIIDGKRCWFTGRKRIPKSNLYWPEPKPKPEKAVNNALPQRASEAVSWLPNDNVLPDRDTWPREVTFDARWRMLWGLR